MFAALELSMDVFDYDSIDTLQIALTVMLCLIIHLSNTRVWIWAWCPNSSKEPFLSARQASSNKMPAVVKIEKHRAVDLRYSCGIDGPKKNIHTGQEPHQFEVNDMDRAIHKCFPVLYEFFFGKNKYHEPPASSTSARKSVTTTTVEPLAWSALRNGHIFVNMSRKANRWSICSLLSFFFRCHVEKPLHTIQFPSFCCRQ